MVLEKIKVLEKVPFDGHILVITDPISPKLSWIMLLMIHIHLTGLIAKSVLKVLDARGD